MAAMGRPSEDCFLDIFQNKMMRSQIPGESDLSAMPKRSGPAPMMDGEAFRRHVKIKSFDEPGCWDWCGSISPYGYGTVWRNGGTYQAHRFSYMLFIGPIDKQMTIDHLCRNRKCVNPSHLEMVTSRENTLRGDTITGKNAKKTTCISGHELSGANLYSRFRKGTERRECVTCRTDASQRYLAKKKDRLSKIV